MNEFSISKINEDLSKQIALAIEKGEPVTFLFQIYRENDKPAVRSCTFVGENERINQLLEDEETEKRERERDMAKEIWRNRYGSEKSSWQYQRDVELSDKIIKDYGKEHWFSEVGSALFAPIVMFLLLVWGFTQCDNNASKTIEPQHNTAKP